uniref:Uncharacterized protein n=1 Tax=Oryza brachyantha TaxID=4533 RepID=J3LDB0_ORYBR
CFFLLIYYLLRKIDISAPADNLLHFGLGYNFNQDHHLFRKGGGSIEERRQHPKTERELRKLRARYEA